MMQIHVTAVGETLFSIAQTYNTTPELLALYNGLPLETPLVPGQALLILIPEKSVIVQPGDTVSVIAARAGLSVNELYRKNPQLHGLPDLYPGQRLTLSYTESPVGTLSVSGYAYPNIELSLLRETLPFLTYLIPFTYGFTGTGTLVLPEDALLRDLAAQYSVDTLLHLSSLGPDGTFSSSRAAMLLQNPDLQERLIDQLIQQLYDRGFVGIDVDFEYVPADLAGGYVQFLQRLKQKLTPLGFLLFSALAPKTSDTQPGDLYQGHDYAGLVAASDGVLLMTYEWGYTYGPPMAVAPIGPVSNVLSYALEKIPPDKIYLGIPNYGYDWPLPFEKGVTRATSIGCQEAVDLAREYGVDIFFDPNSSAPYFFYQQGDQRHEVWFEDVRSIQSKCQLILQNALQGAGYWNLMRPFQQNWQLLDALFQIR